MRTARFLALLPLALMIGLRARPQAPIPPPDYTEQLGGPADGIFRDSPSLAGAEETYLPPLFSSSHAANLLCLRSGKIICVWFSGSVEGASDVGILCAFLPPSGRRWTRPFRIDHHPGESYQNPVPFEAPDGEIWIFHTAQDAGKGQAHARVLVTRSSDQGRTWSSPAVLFTTPGAFVRQPLLVMSDDRWMLPMYMTPTLEPGKAAVTNYSLIKVSADAGTHWGEVAIPNSAGSVQPNLVQLRNGKFVIFFRSRRADFIYRSDSEDGLNWTVPRPTALPNNNASIQAVVLSNGNLVMAFNNADAGKGPGGPPRKPLSVALSDEDGECWRWIRDLEAGVPEGGKRESPAGKDQPGVEEYSYPSIVQAPDRAVYVAYSYRRYTIKIVRFGVEWIKAGKTIGLYRGCVSGRILGRRQ